MWINLKINQGNTPSIEVYDKNNRCIGIFSGELAIDFNEAKIWAEMYQRENYDDSPIQIDPLIKAIDKLIPGYKWDTKNQCITNSKKVKDEPETK